MKKQHAVYLVAGIAVLILATGGGYVYKYRECVKDIRYVPPREGRDAGSGFYGALHSVDKGDYYRIIRAASISQNKFKTSHDAIRACIWQ